MRVTTICSLQALAIMVLGMSCNSSSKPSASADSTDNPFSRESTLALHAPDFTKINNSDFLPALEEGIKQQQAEIALIANNKEAPTFENTLVAIEKSGALLSRVNGVFTALVGANSNDTLQKVQEEEAPKLAANHDGIFLNALLFKRVQTLYAQRDSLQLDPESIYLLTYYYTQFTLAGAALSDSAREALKKYNQEEASLMAKFGSKLQGANKAGALVVADSTLLNGLSAGEKKSAAENAKAAKQEGKWLISLQNTTQQPFLQVLTNRNARQKLFEASFNRAEKGDSNDTRAIIARIAEIRAAQAELMGYKNYAAWKLRDQMAQTPEAVVTFLDRLIPAAKAKAKEEAANIQSVIDQQQGGFTLQPWDWKFYAEQVRKARYDLDENETKPYFELNKVLKDGVFYAANQLYGITFKERKDLPVYHPDVRVFDVIDKDGQQLALFYCDYFKRDNKDGGAWMNEFVPSSKLLGHKPVVYNVCNFPKPAAGEPALISYESVTTMFHEFGHALHGFFADQQYPSLASPNTARDFVEFPSQFNEHWAMDPKVFAHYAVHYKTGAPMPPALVEKIRKAATFNQGYALTEALAADMIDMQWHTLPASAGKQNADSLEALALEKNKIHLAQVPPRYRSSYFLHIWQNGYAAGYYAYAWTEMLDDDAFSWFQENGGLTRANGQRFRDMILSRGNTQPYGDMFKAFCGHPPNIAPMLKSRGLTN
ncbi:peptidyl-dipeptidase Dcp [Chitinophaga costaii]|uniref:Dipeptidyl carboxypeptidase n=1 Tax=Chitinophaga costaii TaxID=1335309 RepID=A0A1C4E3K5_9BACT|nr:peptidyl-dipeptidase Dcp [Chitinophaga costaii]PUZ24342.1 peptidyl-dipeptidase Dcp [Chitinophaga costaii]SCC38174.1 peptidyl-dipeptidase Dcp [Chitinophaga costaii]